MSDQLDLKTVVFHGSPDVSDWPVTVTLRGVEFKSGRPQDGNTCGVRPIVDRTEMNARWPDVRPTGWEGYVQFTIWAFVKIAGVWHGAGLHEFWSNRNGDPRIWTGAPILTQWSDWCYRGQWGPMETYRPQVGDEIGFMLTSGDRRLMDLGDVRERSQAILVSLVADGVAEAPTTPTPAPVPVPVPVPQPPIPQEPDWRPAFAELTRAFALQTETLGAALKDIEALKKIKVPTKTQPTTARLFGLTVQIPSVPLE